MIFFHLLSAELVKYKSRASWLFVFLPLLLAFQIWLQMRHLISVDPGRGTWSMHMQMTCAFWGVFLFTPFVIFWSTHIMAIESVQWKKLLIQGIPSWQLLSTKLLTLFGFILLQTALLVGATAATGSNLHLTGSFPVDRITMVFQAAIAMWPIITIQFCLAIFMRGYLLPIIPSLMGHFASILGIHFALGRYLPWAFSLEFLQIRGAEAFSHTNYFLCAIAMGMGFTLLAFWGMKRLYR